MSMKAGLMLAADLGLTPRHPEIYSKETVKSSNFKPEFTDEELELIRSLPKKQRKTAVRLLRTKYLEKTNDKNR